MKENTEVKEKCPKEFSGRAGKTKFSAYYRGSVRWAMMLYARREGRGREELVSEMEEALPHWENIKNEEGHRFIDGDVIKRFFRGGNTSDDNIVTMVQFIDIKLKGYSESFSEKGCTTKFGDIYRKFVLDYEYLKSASGDQSCAWGMPKIPDGDWKSNYNSLGFDVAKPDFLCPTWCFVGQRDQIIFLYIRPVFGTEYFNVFLIAYKAASQLIGVNLDAYKSSDSLQFKYERNILTENPSLKTTHLRQTIIDNAKNFEQVPMVCKFRGIGIPHPSIDPYKGILVGINQSTLSFSTSFRSRPLSLNFVGIDPDASTFNLVREIDKKSPFFIHHILDFEPIESIDLSRIFDNLFRKFI